MGFFDKVKEVAEKVGDTVEKGAKSATDGSKKLIETRKLKKEIEQTEESISAVFTEVGKKFFAANPGSQEYAAEFGKVNELKSKLESLKKELNILEEKFTCPSCGDDLDKGQKFCDKCGANVEAVTVIPENQPAKETIGKSCTACGAAAEETQKFCEKCGAKLAAEDDVEKVEAEIVE